MAAWRWEVHEVGVLGTGMVGQAIATKLVSLGHAVTMGSRQAGNDKAVAWAAGAGQNAAEGSFADAAAFGETVVNATAGAASLDVLAGAGADNLARIALPRVGGTTIGSGISTGRWCHCACSRGCGAPA